MKEINDEIKKLESTECTTYNVCDKLAKLYIVRYHYRNAHAARSAQPMSAPAMPSMPK
jgi:hypothetical protein